MADGTSFQIDIATKADGVDSAAELVDKLSQRLAGISETSQAAAAAMKAGEAAYAAAETTFDRASKALERITIAADSQKGKLAAAMDVGDQPAIDRASARLAALAQRQGEASAAAERARAALGTEASALDRLRASAASASNAERHAASALADAKSATNVLSDAEDRGTGSAEGAARALNHIGGPLGHIGAEAFRLKGAWSKLGETLGAGGPYVAAAAGTAIVVAGIAAVTAAAVAGIVHIAAWAVGLADASRSQSLLFAGIAHSVAGGDQLDRSIGRLTTTLPLTREELSAMAGTLAQTGLRGDALTNTLERNALAAAKLKFGPDFAKSMLGLDQQSRVLHDHFSVLFGGLNIEALLKQLSSLVTLFDENDASGHAIKVVFESLFQPLINGATAWIPKMRAGFLQFEILVLKALIAIKPWTSKIILVAEAFAALTAIIIGGLLLAVVAIAANIALLAVGFGLIVAAGTAVVAGVVYLGYQFVELGKSIISGAQSGIDWLIGAFNGVLGFLRGISLVEIGAQIIQGLADGITNGAHAVVGAITDTASAAVGAAKKALGIASPSKVFESEVGLNIAGGIAGGIDKGLPAVGSALEAVTSPSLASDAAPGAAPGTAAAAPGASGKGGAGVTLQVTFNGVGGAEDALPLFVSALEGFAAQLGAAVPA